MFGKYFHNRPRPAPLQLYGSPSGRPFSNATRWRQIILWVPLFAVIGTMLNLWFDISEYDASSEFLLNVESAVEVKGGSSKSASRSRASPSSTSYASPLSSPHLEGPKQSPQITTIDEAPAPSLSHIRREEPAPLPPALSPPPTNVSPQTLPSASLSIPLESGDPAPAPAHKMRPDPEPIPSPLMSSTTIGTTFNASSVPLQIHDEHNQNNNTIDTKNGDEWCEQVRKARSNLMPSLHIDVPCATMKPAKSAVVCMLTDGVSEEMATKIVFTATNYIHGAMALGASLMDKIDHSTTHQLLLVRSGFELAPDDLVRLQSVGWTIGTAPVVPLKKRYLPRFPRYKTTYTKISAIGLAEYECAMLMDADTLAVGDLREILSCNIFQEPQHRVGGTLDLYRGYWHYFNTGSVLWRPDSQEMERVFNLTFDNSFMKSFSSDQDFLNNVYPERLNNTINRLIISGELSQVEGGKVVDMTWAYNAQTHVEVERPKWWRKKRPEVRILHFTQKKGWQCEERQEPPPPWSDMPEECDKNIPICYCREAHLYWNALQKAHALADEKFLAAANSTKSEEASS